MKPIYLSEEEKRRMRSDFDAALSNMHLFDGSFSFTRNYAFREESKPGKARILYTATAYVKMMKLIQEFASEIAWHGLVERGTNEGDFIVYDIITHEQTVTGSTVTTEDEQYIRFMENLTDDEAEHLFLQGHSHVNYDVTPSRTDLEHQAKIVQMMSGRKTKGFQIFQIWNKSMKSASFIYDFANNVYYENNDITVDILLDAEHVMTEYIQNARKLVVTKAVAKKNSSGTGTVDPTGQKPREKNHEENDPEATEPLKQNQRGYIPWWERLNGEDVDLDEAFFSELGSYATLQYEE